MGPCRPSTVRFFERLCVELFRARGVSSHGVLLVLGTFPKIGFRVMQSMRLIPIFCS